MANSAAVNANGIPGPTGPAGPGVPTGGTTGQVLEKNSNADYDTKWATIASSGTVTSVGMTGDGTVFQSTVSGSPITTSGTLAPALVTQSPNQVLAGPTSGPNAAPTFRALVAADVPSLDAAKITTGQLALARGGTGSDLSATGGTSQVLKQTSAGGAVTVAQVTDADLSVSDITTNNVSITAHGFAPKLPNDATKFLNGTGAYTVPSGSGSSGALVLLEEHTANNTSTELDFTTRNVTGQSGASIQSDYDEYLIEINQIVPATNLANIIFQFSTNGGSSYDTGSNYAWVGQRQSVAGTAPNVGSNATTSFGMDVSGQVSSTQSRGGLVASVHLYLSANGTIRPKLMWNACNDDGTSNVAVWCIATGTYLSTTAVNAFRITTSSGNLFSGTVRLYGIAK